MTLAGLIIRAAGLALMVVSVLYLAKAILG
jgi:hypothetical protein